MVCNHNQVQQAFSNQAKQNFLESLNQKRAQVSIDYLIMITFVLVFVVAVAVIVTVISSISQQVVQEILSMREKVISSLIE